MKRKERQYARTHAIFLVRNLDKLRQKYTKGPEVAKHDGKDEDYVKGTHFTKKGRPFLGSEWWLCSHLWKERML